MNIGMLWFDNDTKSNLYAKIGRAISYYEKKYGREPDLCFVHPSMLPEELSKSGGIEIRTTSSVLPNHFWIGINSENGQVEN